MLAGDKGWYRFFLPPLGYPNKMMWLNYKAKTTKSCSKDIAFIIYLSFII